MNCCGSLIQGICSMHSYIIFFVTYFKYQWLHRSPVFEDGVHLLPPNTCTLFLISIQLHPGSFFTPLSFINFLTLETSSHLPNEAYVFASREYAPTFSGSNIKRLPAAHSLKPYYHGFCRSQAMPPIHKHWAPLAFC